MLFLNSQFLFTKCSVVINIPGNNLCSNKCCHDNNNVYNNTGKIMGVSPISHKPISHGLAESLMTATARRGMSGMGMRNRQTRLLYSDINQT